MELMQSRLAEHEQHGKIFSTVKKNEESLTKTRGEIESHQVAFSQRLDYLETSVSTQVNKLSRSHEGLTAEINKAAARVSALEEGARTAHARSEDAELEDLRQALSTWHETF